MFPARFLRRFFAITYISTRSRVSLVTYLALTGKLRHAEGDSELVSETNSDRFQPSATNFDRFCPSGHVPQEFRP